MQANYPPPPSLNIRLSTWENTLQTWGIYSTNAHFIHIKCIEWWTYRHSILNFDKKSMLIFSLQHLFFNKSMIIIKIKHVLMNSCNITISYKQHKRLRLMYMDRSINYLTIFCETNFMFHYIYLCSQSKD